MVKLRDAARITHDKRLNKTVPVIKPKSGELGEAIKQAITDSPGISARGILYVVRAKQGSLNGTLHRLFANGEVKRRQLDGLYRYYPLSYRFADEIAAAKEALKMEETKIEEIMTTEKEQPVIRPLMAVEPELNPAKASVQQFLYQHFRNKHLLPSLPDYIKWLEGEEADDPRL